MKFWGIALLALMAYRVHCEPAEVSAQHRVAEMCGGTEQVHSLETGKHGAHARCKDWRLMVVALPRWRG